MQIHRSAPGVPRGMLYAAKCTKDSCISENDEADSYVNGAKFKMRCITRLYLQICRNRKVIEFFSVL